MISSHLDELAQGIERLLIVEDNAGDADYIAALLSDEPIGIEHAATLQRAGELLESERFDVVLLDLRLPDGLGVECVKAVLDVAPAVPIIVLTGLDDQILALRCLAAGAQDYISKNDLHSYSLSRVIRYAVVRGREAQTRSRADRLQALLVAVVNASSDAIISGSNGGLITSWNKAAEKIFGISADEAIGRSTAELTQLFGARNTPGEPRPSEQALMGRQNVTREVPMTRPDGTEIIVQVNAFGVREGDGGIHHFGAICRDVTADHEREARLRLQNEALRQRDRQMRALTARLNNVREEEQRRISREIHDQLGQLLMGLRLNLHQLGRDVDTLQPADSARLGVHVTEGTLLIDATVQAVQRIAAELRPTVLDVAGLPAAIRGEADKFRDRSRMRVITHIDDDSMPPEAIATGLFRIFQEIMTNIARHSEAGQVHIDFGSDDDNWRLSVADDGVGMAGEPARESSLGLLGMRERAEGMNGTIHFDSAPGSGTTVTVQIPR